MSTSQAFAAEGNLIEPSTPADIATAVDDCWHAVGADGVDRERLAASGWSLVTDASGSPVESPLEVLTKPTTNHLLMLAREPGKPLCTVIARAGSKPEAGTVAQAIQKSLLVVDPRLETARDGDGLLFHSGQYFALLDGMTDTAGTPDKPGLRIVVGYKPAEKK